MMDKRRRTDDYILRFRCRGNLPSNVIAQRDEPTELRVGRGGGAQHQGSVMPHKFRLHNKLQ